MDLKIKTERLDASRTKDIMRAAHLLQTGRTVAFPTETVYGLGANVFLPAAIEAVFVAKQRPHWDPLIVHIADREMLSGLANADLQAERLMDAFWPGPLTLLLPRKATLQDRITAGRPLVGVRMPAHAISLELIRAASVPIAAPSANRFGHTSPTTAAHVLDDLDGRIDAVLDGGATLLGLESTVVAIAEGQVTIYRPGAVTAEMLASVMGRDQVGRYVEVSSPLDPPQSMPSPGIGLKHYAPRARLVLVERAEAIGEVIANACAEGGAVAVMLPSGWSPGQAALIYPWGAWDDGEILAQRLFAGLRSLDDSGATTIICPVPPMAGIGDALRDRLFKAARTT